MVWWKKIAEKFNRLSRVHQRHRQQTTDRQTDRQQTDRQTDGRPIAYSERNVVRSLKTRHPIEGYFGSDFRAIYNHYVVMAAWIRNTWKFCEQFLHFLNDPLRYNFKNSVPNVFTASLIDVVFKFSEMLPMGNRWNSALFTWQKNKISVASQTFATARIVPIICQGQPPTMYSKCFRFHPNWFTFSGAIAECVNSVFVPYSVFIIDSSSL